MIRDLSSVAMRTLGMPNTWFADVATAPTWRSIRGAGFRTIPPRLGRPESTRAPCAPIGPHPAAGSGREFAAGILLMSCTPAVGNTRPGPPAPHPWNQGFTLLGSQRAGRAIVAGRSVKAAAAIRPPELRFSPTAVEDSPRPG